MGFKDLLDRKLGPMAGLVSRPQRAPELDADPAALWYRRAAGLEVRVRPDESYNEVEIGRADRPRALTRMTWARAAPLVGLTEWCPAAELPARGLSVKQAWAAVEADLLYYAKEDPQVPMTGRAGLWDGAPEARLRRRRSMWPTAAVATAVQIAPMPFMPRGRDLVGAELVGLRLASLERDHEVFGATITGTEETGRRLRELWALLDGKLSCGEILARFARGRDRDEAEKLLYLLDGLTALEAVGPPSPRALAWAAPQAPQVTWLGHAGVLVQAGGKNVLFDPLFNSDSEPRARWAKGFDKPDPRALPPIHAVFVTHGDNDHLNPNTLVQLPRDVPIYVPAISAQPPPYQVDIRGVLSVLGFDRVRGLEVGDVVDLGGLKVEAWPFVGEDWDLALAQLTFLVEAEGRSVYLSADAGPMPEVYAQLAARPGRVDLALLGVSGAEEPMVSPPDLGYGNFYADWVPRARHNEWRKHCAGPLDAARAAATFRPRFAFGYACGGTPYIPMAYCDRGDHEALASCISDLAPETTPVALPLGEPVRLDQLDSM